MERPTTAQDQGASAVTTSERELAPDRPHFENRRQMVAYLFMRVRETNKLWLLPILLLVMLFGSILNIFSGPNVLPAIYSLIP